MAQAKLRGWGNTWGNRCIKGISLLVHSLAKAGLRPRRDWHQHHSCYSRTDVPSSYLLLMQPGSGIPCTSPGTWASRAAFTRGSAHPAGALCPHGSCILHHDLHQILSHHVSCSCDCPKTWIPGHLVTRRVSPVKILWQLFYCSPA